MTRLYCCENKGKHFKIFEYATTMRFTMFENVTFSLVFTLSPVTLIPIGIRAYDCWVSTWARLLLTNDVVS